MPNETPDVMKPQTPLEMANAIERFNDRHNEVSRQTQFLILAEEIGEFAEAQLLFQDLKVSKDRNISQEDISEELGDILFTSISLCELYDISWWKALQTTIHENAQK